MSDDVAVTEQQEDTQSPDEVGFSDAFDDALKDESQEPEEKEDDKGADEKEDKTAEDEDGKEKKEDDEKKDASEELSEEDKSADERGKVLIEEEEEKVTKDAEEKADLEKKAQAEPDKDPEVIPLTSDQAKTFVNMVSTDELPDVIEIDGVDYNIKEVLEDMPEMQVISGLMTQKVLERLVGNGVLMTAEQHNEKFADIEDRLYGLHFDTTVLRDVPDAFSIVETKEYQEWMEKTATKSDLALLGSNDPSDYIMGLNKFKSVGSPVSDKSKAKAEAKAKAKRDKHNDIHRSSMKATPGKEGVAQAIEKGSNEFSDGFKEAQDKAEKEK